MDEFWTVSLQAWVSFVLEHQLQVEVGQMVETLFHCFLLCEKEGKSMCSDFFPRSCGGTRGTDPLKELASFIRVHVFSHWFI